MAGVLYLFEHLMHLVFQLCRGQIVDRAGEQLFCGITVEFRGAAVGKEDRSVKGDGQHGVIRGIDDLHLMAYPFLGLESFGDVCAYDHGLRPQPGAVDFGHADLEASGAKSDSIKDSFRQLPCCPWFL